MRRTFEHQSEANTRARLSFSGGPHAPVNIQFNSIGGHTVQSSRCAAVALCGLTFRFRPRSHWEPGHCAWRAPVWTGLFFSARPKLWARCPSTGTRSPTLNSDTGFGTGTRLHTILASARAFYPQSSALIVNMAEGSRWSEEELSVLINVYSTSSLNDLQNRAGARAPSLNAALIFVSMRQVLIKKHFI